LLYHASNIHNNIMYKYIHTALDTIRDYAKPATTSTFRETGKLTPDEFVLAGDFLTNKFPSWSWAEAATSAQRISHLPEGKQYLVTRGVPCPRRLNDNFAGKEGLDDLVKEGDAFHSTGDDDDGWLRTGGDVDKPESRPGNIRTVDDEGVVSDDIGDDDDDVPDIEDEEDDPDAIIRDPKAHRDQDK
jgi:ubiquitin-like-conjugating enzyme ATG3